jgi:hypothetical protein
MHIQGNINLGWAKTNLIDFVFFGADDEFEV